MSKHFGGFWKILLIISLCIVGILLIGSRFIFKNKQQVAQSDCLPPQETLKHSPVAEQDLSTIIPLGNLAPPGHVLPTTHMYYNYIHTVEQGKKVPNRTTLYVPADMTVTLLMKMDNADLDKPYEAYRIDFTICKEVSGYFILVQELNEKLAAAMQPPYDNVQESDVGKSVKAHNYYKNVNVKLTAGEILGWAGGEAGFPDGLDLGMVDTRVPKPKLANPTRWPEQGQHYVCSLDYYESELSKRLYAKLGNFNGDYVQPGEPACGTVYQDEPGTAKGVWLTKEAPGIWDVNSLAALVESNFNHSKRVFSLGNKAGALGLSVNWPLQFTPVNSGTVNLDFNLVKPGQVYCYDVDNGTGQANSKATILIELTTNDSLRLGSHASRCGNKPWQFSKTLEYVR